MKVKYPVKGSGKPIAQNGDGDDLMFHNIRYPLKRGVTVESVTAILDTHPKMSRENDYFWNWLKPSGKMIPLANASGTLTFNIFRTKICFT